MKVIGFAAVAATIIGAILFWGFFSGDGEAAKEKAAGKTSPSSEPVVHAPKAPESNRPPTPTIEIMYDPQTSTPDGLVGYSDNVFVGEVMKSVGHDPWTSTIPGDEKPQTQWSVRVSDVLKSSGKDPVSRGDATVVNQIGGEDRKSGKSFVVQGVWDHGSIKIDQLMKPGQSYLLATTYDANSDWQTISAQPTGNQLLSGDDASAQAVLDAFRSAAASDSGRQATGG